MKARAASEAGAPPARGTPAPVRVLVADDSTVMRRAVRRILEADGRARVTAEARDGLEAVRLCAEVRPDVVVMDIRMPRKDGLWATEEIMGCHPAPIVVFTAFAGDDGSVAARALAAGAVFVVAKPSRTGIALDIDQVAEELCARVHAAARIPVVRNAAHKGRAASATPRALRPQPPTSPAPWDGPVPRLRPIVAVGASTGGPQALARLLRAMPPWFGGTLLVVQHLAPGYSAELARHLDGLGPLHVREARHGDLLRPGEALIAPGGHHMQVAGGCVRLAGGPAVKSQRPSVDVLFDSLLPVAHEVHAVLLSGMGDDGVAGMVRLRAAGAETTVQDEASALVWGMPGAAARRGCARRQATPEAIAHLLARQAPARDGVWRRTA